MINVLVTGSDGQLGQCFNYLSKSLKDIHFIFFAKKHLNICCYNDIDNILKNRNVDFIINLAAYTSVNMAEVYKKEAFDVNYVGVENLSILCNIYNITLIHISSDYVFHDSLNKIPLKEYDSPNAKTIYGISKLYGELCALRLNKKTLVLRTSWVYSRFGNNFVKTIINKIINNEIIKVDSNRYGTPTMGFDLCYFIIKYILNVDHFYGILNYSNEGICSWYHFALEVNKYINKGSTAIYQNESKNLIYPFYTVLDKEKIKFLYRIKINRWQTSLNKEIKYIINHITI